MLQRIEALFAGVLAAASAGQAAPGRDGRGGGASVRHPVDRHAGGMNVRRVRTTELTAAEVRALRTLFDAAWPGGQFDETDWEHATGGVHVLLEVDGRIVSHASVVPRELVVGDRAVPGGYVEAVATHPDMERRGFGSVVMREVAKLIAAEHDLGALSTGSHAFYERLGWRRWRGPTFVRTPAGPVRTEDEDEGVMVLPSPAMPEPDVDAPISVAWRRGDAW